MMIMNIFDKIFSEEKYKPFSLKNSSNQTRVVRHTCGFWISNVYSFEERLFVDDSPETFYR